MGSGLGSTSQTPPLQSQKSLDSALPLHSNISEMSYTTIASSFSLFPAATTTPHAFDVLASSHSYRETYHMYEDARLVLGPINGRLGNRKTSFGSSRNSGLKKLFGL